MLSILPLVDEYQLILYLHRVQLHHQRYKPPKQLGGFIFYYQMLDEIIFRYTKSTI
jgi:hypothetical protein